MIQTVLLDIDGTLIDSNDAHARAWVEALIEQGIGVTYQDVRELIGMGSDHLLPTLTEIEAKSDWGKLIKARRGEIFRESYLPTLKAFPGARSLLERLRGYGVQLVVASSASREDLEALLHQAGIADLLPLAASADDANASKPSPDIVRAALQKAEAEPANAYLIGDTPYDIESAARSGVSTIAFTCGGWSHEALAKKGALAIYRGPADLWRHFENSPLMRGERRRAG